LFNAIPEVVAVFLYLHNTVENIVKIQLEAHVDKEIVKNCLKVLNEDIQLREMWFKVLGNEDNFKFKSGCVLLLHRVVGMFVKSKQQIIREQLQLKPSKQSSSLRQSLSNKRKSKKVKQVSQSDEYVLAYRQNPTDIAKGISDQCFCNAIASTCNSQEITWTRTDFYLTITWLARVLWKREAKTN
jgi:hypothetical protein